MLLGRIASDLGGTFLYEKKNKKKLILPSPRLIEIKDWLKVPNYTKEGIYKGIKIDNKNRTK